MIASLFAWLTSILSEDNNQGSFSRVSGAVIILALIAWASWIVMASKAIPDVPDYWLFLVLGLYGINKGVDGLKSLATAIAAAKGRPANAETPAA